MPEVRCPGCSASVTCEKGEQLAKCPYCGAELGFIIDFGDEPEEYTDGPEFSFTESEEEAYLRKLKRWQKGNSFFMWLIFILVFAGLMIIAYTKAVPAITLLIAAAALLLILPLVLGALYPSEAKDAPLNKAGKKIMMMTALFFFGIFAAMMAAVAAAMLAAFLGHSLSGMVKEAAFGMIGQRL